MWSYDFDARTNILSLRNHSNILSLTFLDVFIAGYLKESLLTVEQGYFTHYFLKNLIASKYGVIKSTLRSRSKGALMRLRIYKVRNPVG